MNNSITDSLEIQTSDFTPAQLAILNDRLRRIQANFDGQGSQGKTTLLTFHVTGNLINGNNVAPLLMLPSDALVSSVTVMLKTAPNGVLTFRLNVNGVVWQGVLQAIGTFRQINLGTPAKMPGNQPVTLDIINAASAADLTILLQGSYS